MKTLRNSKHLINRSVLRVKSHLTSCTASSTLLKMETDRKILLRVPLLCELGCALWVKNVSLSSVCLEHEEISHDCFSSQIRQPQNVFARINTLLCIFRLTWFELYEVKLLPVRSLPWLPFPCSGNVLLHPEVPDGFLYSKPCSVRYRIQCQEAHSEGWCLTICSGAF